MSKEPHTQLNYTEAKKPMLEIAIALICAVAVYLFSATHDVLEKIVAFAHQHEHWELDEIIPVSLFILLSLAIFAARRWKEAARAREIISQQNHYLRTALSEAKQLKDLIPICGSCDAIRFDSGYWHQVGKFIRDHAGSGFAYSLCPDCARKEYPGLHVVGQEKHDGNRGSNG